MKLMRRVLVCFGIGFVLFLFVYSAFSEDKILMMATTTSTDNTGLLDYLAPHLQKDTGIQLRWVAVGTGKALVLGKNCDVDVLMVHAPEVEKQYVTEGYGRGRTQIMYNDFVIIGPDTDPAGISGRSVLDALGRIFKAETLFTSRGDDSGTNKMEKSLWIKAGITIPEKEKWYIQTGQGMLNTINIAAEMAAYTLTDRGTYIKYVSNHDGAPPLAILVEGDSLLRNQYSVISANPDNCPNAQYELTLEFIEWLTSKKTQKLIGDFRLLGKQLFIPNADRVE